MAARATSGASHMRSRARHLREAVCAVPLVLLVAAASASRWLGQGASSSQVSFTLAGSRAASVNKRLATRCGAYNYGPLVRRDPDVNSAMQMWISQMVKAESRVANVRTGDDAKKKAAYLEKLGIKRKEKPLWHIDHLKEGDVLTGWIEHPDFGIQFDLTVEVTGDGIATWSSKKGEFDSSVTLLQDWAMHAEPGKQRKLDQAAYIFSKFNFQWRDLMQPSPPAEDLEHLSLKGLRFFFKMVASVDGYPSDEDWKKAVADPEKGMTLDEFTEFTTDESNPTWLDATFKTVFTGRRISMTDGDITLEGDFATEVPNCIFGYVYNGENPGGLFSLKLKQ